MQLCKRENFVGTEEKSGGLGCLGAWAVVSFCLGNSELQGFLDR